MPFNFCPKRDASFWKNGSELKRFVLELQTGGFADYTSAGNQQGKEGEILKAAIPYALVYVCITGIIVYLFS